MIPPGDRQAARGDWSAEQQRLLAALGYTLYRPVTAAAPAVENDRDRPQPAAAAAPPPPPAPPPRSARLLDHLRLAAGGHDPARLAIDLSALRGDAAAKRALWPRLRTLRRTPP